MPDGLAAVGGPDRRPPGRRSDEEWIYKSDAGPSRWLKVVVSYHGAEGRIITAAHAGRFHDGHHLRTHVRPGSL